MMIYIYIYIYMYIASCAKLWNKSCHRCIAFRFKSVHIDTLLSIFLFFFEKNCFAPPSFSLFFAAQFSMLFFFNIVHRSVIVSREK